MLFRQVVFASVFILTYNLAILPSAIAADLTSSGNLLMRCTHTLKGPITTGDAAKIEKVHKDDYIRTLCLESPGGSWSEAISIAGYLYENRIPTAVGPFTECYSACAVAFLGGSRLGYDFKPFAFRSLHKDALLGFHAPYLEGIKDGNYPAEVVLLAYREAMNSVSKLLDLSEELGLPEDFLVQVLKTGRGDMYVISTMQDIIDLSINLVGYRMPQGLSKEMIERACAARSQLFREQRVGIEASSSVSRVGRFEYDDGAQTVYGFAVANTHVESSVYWYLCKVGYRPRAFAVVESGSEANRFLGTGGEVLVEVEDTPFKEFHDGAFSQAPPLKDEELKRAIYSKRLLTDDLAIQTEIVFNPGTIISERAYSNTEVMESPVRSFELREFNGEPTGNRCFVVIASRSSLEEIYSYVNELDPIPSLTSVLVAKNGWFSATVGTALKSDGTRVVQQLIKESDIPSDSYCAESSRFVDVFKFVSSF